MAWISKKQTSISLSTAEAEYIAAAECHYIREQATNKNIKLEYIPTKEQVAYIFTKPLKREAFEHLRQKFGVISSPK